MKVAVVIGRDADVIDFAGPWEVFHDAGEVQADAQFELYTVSDTTAPLTVQGPLTITPDYDYTIAPQPDIILIGAQPDHTPAKIAWIQKASEKAQLTVSNCLGAFLLAKTGLLDGLTATTHHDFYDSFEQQFPKVKLLRGPRYVEHEKIMTGGGLTSGFEVALRILERFYGAGLAQKTAYFMEYDRSPDRPST